LFESLRDRHRGAGLALERDFPLDVYTKLHVMEMKPAFREVTDGHEDQMYKMAKTMLSMPRPRGQMPDESQVANGVSHRPDMPEAARYEGDVWPRADDVTDEIPVSDAGPRTEMARSVPRPIGDMPAAIAAASPPLEPPGVRVRSQGLFDRPVSRLSVSTM
jgi:hypothetical protein